MFLEYIIILKYFLFCLIFVFFLYLLSFLVVYQQSSSEKGSAYECGFNPFSDARNKFEVKFYLIAVLFIIFDLELTFLFLWIVNIFSLTLISNIIIFFFFFVLTIGFIYEWLNGVLD